MVSIDEIEKHLGSRVRDPYGRILGVLVSIYSDVDGTITGIEVMREDGYLSYVPSERVSISPEALIVLPEWRVEAVRIEQQLDRARKRARALEELFSSKDIGSQAYEEMKKGLEATLSRLKEKARNARGMLKKRLGELEDEILHIDKAINHLKLGYTAGEIGEQRFKTSIDGLRSSKSRAQDEKSDIEKHLELLERLENEAIVPQKIPVEVQATQPKIEAPQQGQTKPIEVRIVSS